MKNYGIILASGSGSRFNKDIPKQFVKIANKTILEHSIEVFEKSDSIDEIIVVINPDFKDISQKIIQKNNYKKVTKILNGGAIRKESSYIGISSIDDKEANILIHDCARPFVTKEIIEKCTKALEKYSAAVVAIPTTDTIFTIKDNKILSIPNRDELMCAQTPQCFKLSLIKKAHEMSKNDENFTDDCGLIIKNNLASIHIIQGSSDNIKITYESDYYLAEKIFEKQQQR